MVLHPTSCGRIFLTHKRTFLMLPITNQVSSVIITAEVDVTVRKGEELSYFQFGGSDIILLFEASSNVCLTAQPTVHYKMGTKIGQAYPVI